ncbi:hypothetical protein [Marinitoga sp. 38H-ov]|uniref:hypothetical protein n=1 Tax=Marinitoga sp. 38H-ov TaxID=1755814 RepID=UPI0013EB3D93|nr:hypothetical protein [Marinitoga sp. 38H-ov]KAF2956387.1 hypothetical protein AS160_06690 [Marinitoga sp. 38H-ov]
MKYHSKSPEEWENYDKKKNKNDSLKSILKRRQKVNNFIIIMISSLTIVMILLSKYYFPRYKFSYSTMISSVSISLNTLDNYYFPDSLNINVSMNNTSSKHKNIEISDFKFNIYRITNNSSETFYKFEYSKIINYDLNPLEIKKIFDLEKINPISEIKHGNYVIETSFNFNNKKIKLKKEFNYIHSIIYNIYLEKDFYLTNERPKIFLEAINYSSDEKNINIIGKIQIFNKKRKLINEIPINFGYTYLKSLEKNVNELYLPPLEDDVYELYFVNKELNQAVYIPLPITNKIEKKLTKVNLAIDTYLFYPINELFQGAFYIDNLDLKNKRFLEIEGFTIRLLNIENNTLIFNYENNDIKRIYINEGGKSLIHYISKEPPIKLNIPGNYKLIFSVKSNENVIERTLDLYVGLSRSE